tara:strand:- start:8799 stop:10466 length:1668 start_codon:yes stop_codon:yes gene_type:complete
MSISNISIIISTKYLDVTEMEKITQMKKTNRLFTSRFRLYKFKVLMYCASFFLIFSLTSFRISKEKHIESFDFLTDVSTPFNIVYYGAKGDGHTLNTKSIQSAIDACFKAGGGTVYFPAGTYRSGTIFLKSNVHISLAAGAILLASKEHKDFPRQPIAEYRSQKDTNGWYALIFGEGLSNIAITGMGEIDGNGAFQKPRTELKKGDSDGRPRNLLLISCNQVKIEGITMKNSGVWNQHYLNCEDVIIDKVKVFNHSNRNNDAVDIDGCRRVVISNSIFDSDDDGITLKSTGLAPTEDVTISNCVISSFCNAIKAGTESTGGFKNIVISNCVIKPSNAEIPPIFNTPKHGISGISLEIVDGGTMEGIAISNIVIEGTECPLYIRLGNRARKHVEEALLPKMGHMRNITISNVTAYNTGNFSSSITAIPGSYIENISLSNIQLFNKGGIALGDFITDYTQVEEKENSYPQPTVWGNLPSSVFFIRHVKNLSLANLSFGSQDVDPRIPINAIDVINLSIDDPTFSGGDTNKVFVLMKDVTGHKIEKPLGWIGNSAFLD